MRWAQRTPAHVINGLTVALGIGLLQALLLSFAGAEPAKLAITGAICVSLSDVPGTVARSWRRLLVAATLACCTTVLIALLRPFPVALGAAIVAVVFAAMMTLAWGPRAGPVSFAAVLAIVFTIGMPPEQDPRPLALWTVVGALAYIAWALVTSAVLQARYRSLALAATLHATAQLLRSRAELLTGSDTAQGNDGPLQAWVRDEAALAERLQAARDLLFAAPDDATVRQQSGALSHLINLRDMLLASRLDLELLGHDEPARSVRSALATQLRQMAELLDAGQARLRGAGAKDLLAVDTLSPDSTFGESLAMQDARARLLPGLADRLRHMHEDVAAALAMACGEGTPPALSREGLRMFVTPESWPLKALRPHLTLASPVLRHAVRASLAMGAAYGIALLLPWASHPQWLVLSVAVVLRGNMQQTLARRNLRIGGTVLGCLLVVLLAQRASPALMLLVFVTAVGLAHGFAVERYLVTATAGTIMALLQAHLVNPVLGFPVAERIADTVLGALLAWGFSYVLPSWERRGLPQAVDRAVAALRAYSGWALRTDDSNRMAQHLARRQAYDALGAVSTSLQRSGAEPGRVRVPAHEISILLDHGQRLMAHLSMVRMTLARRAAVLVRSEADAAMADASRDLQAALTASDGELPAFPPGMPPGLDLLPQEPPSRRPLPWLQRRLQAAVRDGQAVAVAAHAVRAKLGKR